MRERVKVKQQLLLVKKLQHVNKIVQGVLKKMAEKSRVKKKDRKKNIVGTIFLYNPVVTPIGFDSNKFLLDQGFEQFGEYVELKCETYITTFKQAMNGKFDGKLVEIKNLFNLIESAV